MKTKREQSVNRKDERGNALIYVLIAIALFAALSFTLGRQTEVSEVNSLSAEKAELRATELITYAAQVKSAIDQMMFTGATSVNELDFTPPTDPTFDDPVVIHKVYHPQGGGLIPGTLPDDVIAQAGTSPYPGWYLGRHNNVEWTSTTADDVILVAYQISRPVCELINKKITGTTAIPQLTTYLRSPLIDGSYYGSTSVDLTTDDPGDVCPACHNMGSMCVESSSGGSWAFYTVIADQ